MSNWLERYCTKRGRKSLQRQISNVNWRIVSKDLYCFIDTLLKDHPTVFYDFSVEKTDGNMGHTGFFGFESLQVTQTNRMTGTGNWSTNGDGAKVYNYHKDYGVNLDINFSVKGSINVFLRRVNKCEALNWEAPNLLLFYTDDPLKLTEKKVIHFIKTMLFYAHATSFDRKLSILDKLKLASLELKSHVRRKSMGSYLYELFSNSFFSIITIILATLALYIGYLTLLATVPATG
ncbi:hypothetical protein CXF83_15095 [Shewanella sp. Choline-02u-19]|uniref:hypothetical protein n=1 Tax=unclassified Shewanella TaxID=196818 RepID=UPI000C34B2CC|nr:MULTISPECIES: hypothetical protein [unclassified Shewanella]PKH62180.1 hypothetical protein CXF84_01325 [Shewanella sp. Bg11-22]PKI27943.1 hypothetical protein CXF83_15095 [Shewanella sp. Choline-02u-19]